MTARPAPACPGTLCAFPWTPNRPLIPILTATFVGVADYMADGSLTQMASRVGRSVPNFYCAGPPGASATIFGAGEVGAAADFCSHERWRTGGSHGMRPSFACAAF